jgi:glycerate kinase
VCLIAGQVSDRDKLLAAGFASVECINPPSLPLTTAMQKSIATQNIEQTAARLASCYMSEGAEK